MRQNFKNFIFIFIFIVFLLLPSLTSAQNIDEKATQRSLSTEEWLECLAKVVDEFYPPIKACIEKNGFRHYLCDKIANEQKEASDKEATRRCGDITRGKSPSPTPTEQPTQDQSSNSNQFGIPNYTQALVIKPPEESDFQKVKPSDFQIVYPENTSSATPKPATESASITGSIFIGKVDGDDALILQLPDGEEIELKDDKTAIETKRPNRFRFRNFKGSGNNYIAPKRHVYVKEIDCHILLEQERRDQEMIKRLGGIIYASDWGVDDTIIIVKPIGDCSYTNEGGPVRVLAEKGQATFQTPGGDMVSADNADFGIGYNAKSNISIFEIYNGSITVKNKAGNTKTISATYGSEIKQIEVDKDGVISEKIAIPLSQWQAFLASKQEKKTETEGNTLPIVGAVAVLGLVGIAFFLYRTGKLLPLYRIANQKIADIHGKINREKKTD